MTDAQDESDGGFLARWSKRKEGSKRKDWPKQKASARIAETATPRKTRGGAAPSLPEQAPEASLPDLVTGEERPLTEEEQQLVDSLPDIESLGAESDFTPFMQSKVPEFLRRRALRALWRLNPVLANVDGLVDYGEDYTDAAMVIDGMQTAYRVGKGFMTDEELAEQSDEEEAGVELPQAQNSQADCKAEDDGERQLAAAEGAENEEKPGAAIGSEEAVRQEQEAEEVGEADLE